MFIHEWKSEALALNDGDIVGAWAPSLGSEIWASAGTAPLFVSGANSPLLSGKPVIRFDGIDDYMVIGSLDNARHVFILAAYRGLFTGPKNVGLFGAADGSDLGLPQWWNDGKSITVFADGSPKYNLFRDGVDTNSFYDNGQFALYEGIQLSATMPKPVTAGQWAGRVSPWDICYIAISDEVVTGETLTNYRAAILANYLEPQNPAGFENQVLDIRAAADSILAQIQVKWAGAAGMIGLPDLPPIKVFYRSAAGRLTTVTPCLLVSEREAMQALGDHLSGAVQLIFEFIIDGGDTEALVTAVGNYALALELIFNNLKPDTFSGTVMGNETGRHQAFTLGALETHYDQLRSITGQAADAYRQNLKILATFQLQASPIL